MSEIVSNKVSLEEWDRRFMKIAQEVSGWSKDPSTKVGALIVGRDPRDVVFGYNGFPPGIADDDRLFDRDKKYKTIIHAERNALDRCRFDTTGATIYATLCPCPNCVTGIISKGLGRVVCPEPDWEGDQAKRLDLEYSLRLLDEAGIGVSWFRT